MKKSIFKITLLICSFFARIISAQEASPVNFKVETKKISATEYDIIFKEAITEGWHIYSINQLDPDGPNATKITFNKSADYELVGKLTESKPVEEFDKQFSMKVLYFIHNATFTQRIKLKTNKTLAISGKHEFQACTDEKCIFPPAKKFSVTIEQTDEAISTNKQESNPVNFEITAKKISATEYDIILNATLEKDWHMYSITQTAAGGPNPTRVTFNKSDEYELVGQLTESKPIKEMDNVFKMQVAYFKDKATFTQRIKVKTPKTLTLTGKYEYEACATSCVFPFKNFSVTIEQEGEAAVNNEPLADSSTKKEVTIKTEDKSNSSANTPWWLILLKGIGFGLAALITPCVFPMIPMNVSFFLKRNKQRSGAIKEALFFMLSIIVIYTALGLLITAFFGDTALNAIASSAGFNVFFFLILLVFGISFLGAFEIVLPSSWLNKMDAQSDRGGFLGIFFMATTLSLVSFSCTGVFIGNLIPLVSSSPTGPLFGFLGFGFGFALPFGLFAIVPSLLQNIPKSGGWLNTVKVTLGLLELALALKFASNADLVYQAHILPREIFLTLWIVIFALTGIYLMGWFKLSHDSPMEFLSIPRLFFAILAFSFTVYMVPGLFGAPLKLLSGVIPPSTYAEWQGNQSVSAAQSSNQNTASGLAAKMVNGPEGLKVFHNDYESALAYAKEVHKPLLIDFTGHACANCRKMEDNVWPDPVVKNIMANDLVIVSLFVDDRKELPAAEQKEVQWNGDMVKLETEGMKWGYFQNTKYKISSQPYYVIVDSAETELSTNGIGYDTGKDVNVFKTWLNNAITNYKAKH